MAQSNWKQIKEIQHLVEPWPELNILNRKEEIILNRLKIDYPITTRGYLIRKSNHRHTLLAIQASQLNTHPSIIGFSQRPEKNVESQTTSTALRSSMLTKNNYIYNSI